MTRLSLDAAPDLSTAVAARAGSSSRASIASHSPTITNVGSPERGLPDDSPGAIIETGPTVGSENWLSVNDVGRLSDWQFAISNNQATLATKLDALTSLVSESFSSRTVVAKGSKFGSISEDDAPKVAKLQSDYEGLLVSALKQLSDEVQSKGDKLTVNAGAKLESQAKAFKNFFVGLAAQEERGVAATDAITALSPETLHIVYRDLVKEKTPSAKPEKKAYRASTKITAEEKTSIDKLNADPWTTVFKDQITTFEASIKPKKLWNSATAKSTLDQAKEFVKHVSDSLGDDHEAATLLQGLGNSALASFFANVAEQHLSNQSKDQPPPKATTKGKKRKTGDDDSIDDGEAAGDGDGGTAAAKRPKSGVGSPTKPGRGRGGGTRGGPRGGA